MKKLKAKTLAMFLVVACLTISTSAATNDGTFTASSNREFYTPKRCSIVSNSEHIYFENMQWEERSYGAAYYWEGELRGVNENISAAYSNATSVAGSLPYLYKEYDENDVSIGCRDMGGIVGNTNYYASLTATEGPRYDNGVDLYFESEYGIYAITDGYPLHYQAFQHYLNTKTCRNLAWGFI